MLQALKSGAAPVIFIFGTHFSAGGDEKLYGIKTDDGKTIVTVDRVTCAMADWAVLPKPVYNASRGSAPGAPPLPPSCVFNGSSGAELFCVVADEGRNTVQGFDVVSRSTLGDWRFPLNLGFLQMDLSTDLVLLGGGGLMCGQPQGQECIISLEPATGKQSHIIVSAGVELGVLYTASQRRPWLLWQTKTEDAQSERIVVLDWTKSAGQQIVMNSSNLPVACAEGAYACESTGFFFYDD
jgi:hypothetical protein